MSLGTFKATVIAIDAAGKVRTVTNTISIKVTNNIAECYDDATVAAVRSFQSRNGLSVDGSAGQETLAVLYGSNPRAAY